MQEKNMSIKILQNLNFVRSLHETDIIDTQLKIMSAKNLHYNTYKMRTYLWAENTLSTNIYETQSIPNNKTCWI
jgi:hypothetical protein